MKKTLFNKNFNLVVIGQIVSLFGNAILRFALPLYLLRQTHSVALFGLVSGLSFIPLIIMSLLGGIIADRRNKRNIMVTLDFATALIIFGYALLYQKIAFVPFIITILMLLYAIQGAYQPAVQSSIPLLLPAEKVISGNSVITMVNSLANFVGPTLGGILFGLYGIMPILIVSILCFVLSAFMELWITIPFHKVSTNTSFFKLIHQDLKLSLHFMINEKPILAKSILLIAAFNLILSSMLIIGMPSIITQTLQLSDQAYGVAQGILAIGAIIGGLLAGLFNRRLNIRNLHRLLLGCSLAIIPMILALACGLSISMTYGVITAMGFIIMSLATLFSIQMMTFVQLQTPPQLVGKVISSLLAFSLCAMPIGQALYGLLFNHWSSQPHIILIGTACLSAIIALISKNVFGHLD